MAESSTKVIVTMTGHSTSFGMMKDYRRFCQGVISLEEFKNSSPRDKVKPFRVIMVEGVESYPNGEHAGENS